MISSEVLDERLKFLDPELKATHSRIDILETICQANTGRIEAILQASPNNSSKHARKRLNGLNAGERLLPVLLLFLWLFCFFILFYMFDIQHDAWICVDFVISKAASIASSSSSR